MKFRIAITGQGPRTFWMNAKDLKTAKMYVRRHLGRFERIQSIVVEQKGD